MLYCRIECWKMLVAHLAVWGWLLLLCPTALALAQNHTCYRTETVEVRVAVPLQEPVTFRSYTWCLKVPPRCSKYTVVMRERITYETEVRNQTVSECCAGYVSLYGECVPACTECANMRCDNTRICTCAAGYIGHHCNETCELSKWGDRCLETCICRVGEDCDSVSGTCSPSTSTPAPPTTTAASTVSTPAVRTTHLPRPSSKTSGPATTPKPSKNTPTTPNTFVNLTLTDPTTSTEDLTDFNVILRPRTNDSVRLVNKNNDVNSLNALGGDLDYPILPTDSAVESFNYIQADHEPNKNTVMNDLSVNSSVVNARWISELGAHSSITLGSVLGLLALLVVTVSGVVRCRKQKAAQHQVSSVEKNSLHLVARNSHYAVPGPPPFSFLNGYGLDTGVNEETYDHPRSARCLEANEPVYDELRY